MIPETLKKKRVISGTLWTLTMPNAPPRPTLILRNRSRPLAVNGYNDDYRIMEPGGRMDGIVGIGPDGIFRTEDDLDVPFIYDQYSPRELYDGFENTVATISYGLSTGMADSEQDGPTLLSVDLNTPTNDHLDIRNLTVLFSEPVDTASATLPTNYRLIEAGPNGIFEDGLGEDRTIGATATMDGEDQVLLAVASSDASLPLGRYQLTVLGNNTGVTDLNEDTLGRNSQYPTGRDISVEFQVTVPAIGDWYRMSVKRGDTVTLWAETPYDATESSPLNDLDAKLLVISPTERRCTLRRARRRNHAKRIRLEDSAEPRDHLPHTNDRRNLRVCAGSDDPVRWRKGHRSRRRRHNRRNAGRPVRVCPRIEHTVRPGIPTHGQGFQRQPRLGQGGWQRFCRHPRSREQQGQVGQ